MRKLLAIICRYLYMGLNLGRQQQPPFRYEGAISRKIRTLKDKRPPFKTIFGSEACEHSLMERQHRIRNGKCFLNAFAKMDRLLSITFSALHFLSPSYIRSMTELALALERLLTSFKLSKCKLPTSKNQFR